MLSEIEQLFPFPFILSLRNLTGPAKNAKHGEEKEKASGKRMAEGKKGKILFDFRLQKGISN